MIIVLYIVIVIILLAHLKMFLNGTFIASKFKRSNIIVFGRKGSGKDLIFQKVINLSKKPHLANMVYNEKTQIIDVGDLNVSPNTYEDFIDGTVQKTHYYKQYNKSDVYISDAGVILPSQYDSKLDKKYPSLPILYALSRQAYQMNCHVNTQALNRVWKKLREQADGYFKALMTISLPFMLYTKVRYFEEYQSADANLLPFKKTLMNKDANALKKQYDATNGKVIDMWICQRKKMIKYDTYYFRKVLFRNIDLEPLAYALLNALSI